MKKNVMVCLVVLSLFTIKTYAQRDSLKTNDFSNYHELMKEKYKHLISNDSSYISNGVFYNISFPLSQIHIFNTDSFNTSNANHFLQTWKEINKAKVYGVKNSMNTDDIRSFAYGYESNDTLALGIIDVDYSIIPPNYLDSTNLTLENNPIYEDSLGYFRRRENKNPYSNLHRTIISPLNSSQIHGNQLHLKLSPFILSYTAKSITGLSVSYGSQTHQFISNSQLANSTANFTFENSGTKKLKFDLTYSNGTQKTTYANVQVKILSAEQIAFQQQLTPIQATEDFNGIQGKGEYLTFLANGHSQLTKPIIITDGFDPNDERGILTSKKDGVKTFKELTSYDQNGNKTYLINKLNTEGYDVRVLNFIKYKTGTQTIQLNTILPSWIINLFNLPTSITFDVYNDGGADYIERNAKVLKQLIKQTNTELINNGSNEELVVIGPSMGGLISRIALTEMEQANENHNTRLYVSFDSPHNGANISIGVQKSAKFNDSEDALYSLNTPAAKQMLLNHYSEHDNWESPQPNQLRNSLITKLDNAGFPQQTDRNIALLNGTTNGTQIGSPGSNIVNFDKKIWVWITIFPIPYRVWLRIRRDEGGVNTEVFSQKEPNHHSVNKYAFAHGFKGSLDCSPGGAYDIIPSLQKGWNNGISAGSEDWYVFGISNGCVTEDESTSVNENFCFIPTKSALAYTGSNQLWAEDISCQDLVCEAKTPFDNYYAPDDNQFHVEVTKEGVDWLLAELNENPIYNYNSGCSYQTPELHNYQPVVCTGYMDGYTLLSNCFPTSWETSNGISITNQFTTSGNSFVEIQKNNNAHYSSSTGKTNRWVKANFADGSSLTKYLMDRPLFKINESSFSNINTGSLEYNLNIEPRAFSFLEQEVDISTDIEWEIISQSPNAVVNISNNQLSAHVYSGQSPEFFVNGKVKITNSCGTKTRSFFVSYPQVSGPIDNSSLLIFQIAAQEYQVFDPSNPEQNIISSSQLYNTYGILIEQYLHSGNEVDIDENGMPAIRVLKVQMNGKEASRVISIN